MLNDHTQTDDICHSLPMTLIIVESTLPAALSLAQPWVQLWLINVHYFVLLFPPCRSLCSLLWIVTHEYLTFKVLRRRSVQEEKDAPLRLCVARCQAKTHWHFVVNLL